jgi:hypothetical protein
MQKNNCQSKKSKKRQEKRESAVTQEFRQKVIQFLGAVNADPEISYMIQRDLSLKTDMEFYGIKKNRVRRTKSHHEIVLSYFRLLSTYQNNSFSEKLLRKLSVQQNQTIRKLAVRSKAEIEKKNKVGGENGVWEHVIPTKCLIDEIILLLESPRPSADKEVALEKILGIFSNVGQRFITVEQDKLLSAKFKHSMPEKWSWWDENGDPYARYKAVGIES